MEVFRKKKKRIAGDKKEKTRIKTRF